MNTKVSYTKKYSNSDFYTDGKFNQELALKAYLDMFEFYGIPFTDFMKENLWVNYFGHEIYLLPNQMIVEHAHVPTEHQAKGETWLVRKGSCYNYSIGEPTPNAPKLPESQKDFITVSHFKTMKIGDVVSLPKIETKHFLFAGDEGLVVTEFGSFHDGDGLRFTNPGVKF